MEQGYKLRFMGRALGFLLLFITLAGTLWGQSTANYTFTTATDGSLTDMSSGTTLLQSTTAATDQASAVVDIGFPFVFMGVPYTQFSVNNNGLMRLGSTVIGTEYTNALATASNLPLLAPFWDDLNSSTTAGTTKTHYKVTGSAPSRILTVEWKDAIIAYNASTAGGGSTFQVRLFEESGKIEYVYGTMTIASGSSSVTASIGFTNTNANNGLISVTSLSTPAVIRTTAGVVNNLVNSSTVGAIPELNSASDGNRRVFTFEPGVAATAPTDITFSSVGLSTMTLNWVDSPDEVKYAVFNSTDGTNFTLVNGNVAAGTTTFAATGLNPGTIYYWRVYALSEGKLGTPLSGSQVTNAASFSGTKSIGPGGDYETLTAAIAAATASGLSGAAIFELQSTFTGVGETLPITIGSIPGASAANTLTIRPVTGATGLSISGSNTTAILDLNGARYVIVDGRPGGTGALSQLTMSNTSTSGATIRLINDASNNTMQYLDLRGIVTSTTSGVVLFSTTTGTTGNDNNTIAYCHIRDGASTPTNGIYAAGTASKTNDNNTISNCNIFNFFNASSDNAGIKITSNNTSWSILNNSFYQTTSRTYSSGVFSYPISIVNTSGNGFTVSGNYIGGTAENCGSTPWTVSGSSNRFLGIDVQVSTTGTSSIQGNTIGNLTFSTTSGATSSPYVYSGIRVVGNVNIGTVTANSVGTATLPISWTSSTTSGVSAGIVISAGTGATVDCRNNTITNISILGSTTSVGHSFLGIENTTGGTITIQGNTIGSTSVANAINLATATSGNLVQAFTGIRNALSSSPTLTIASNTIANINNATSSTSASSVTFGIRVGLGMATVSGNIIRNITTASTGISGGTTPTLAGIMWASSTVGASQIISGNTVHSLFNIAASANVSVYGIYYAGAASGTNSVTKNNVHSLSIVSTSATADLRGIVLASGLVAITNNMVRLGINAAGDPLTTGIQMTGIYDVVSTSGSSIDHNSVFIGGTGVGTQAGATYAFRSEQNTNTRLYRNNIFVNERSNETTGGKHYAVRVTGTGVNPTGLTLNYNIYRASGTGSVFGYYNTDQANFADWKAATGQDVNSLDANPLFTNTTGNSSAVDLHLQVGTPAESAGTLIATVTDDFDSQTRADLSPVDIGADAGDYGTDFVTWANLQSPATASVKEGVGVLVYAQVYVAGVTDPAGQGAGITGWIGYSTDNTNPNTWTNWVPATFNVQSGNNDEYMAKIGATLPAGTYYYASRFKYNTSSFYFGGYNGGAWNGTTNVSGVLTITDNTVGWANLQFPGTATIQETQSVNVYGRVWIDEVTLSSDTTAAITAWVGVNTANTDPSTWAEGSWKRAFFNTHAGNNDEYVASIGNNLAPGTYYYATRYKFLNDSYVYGGYNVSGGNFWDGSTNVNGTLTVGELTLTPPLIQDFAGTFPPTRWTRFSGLLANSSVLTSVSDTWVQGDWRNVTSPVNKSARINIWSTTKQHWFVTPSIDLGTGTNYELIFDLSLNAYSTSGTPATTGTDDKFAVVISTDNGTTWTSANTLRLWDNAGSPNVYNSINYLGETVTIPLSGYTGSIKLAFYGESTVSNADNDLFVDNVRVRAIPSATNSSTIAGGSTGSTTFGTTGTTIQFTVANTGDLNLTVDKIGSNPGGTPPGSLQNIAPQYWSITVTSGTVNGTYSITLDITGVPGVTNPATLHLLKRDNASGAWTDLGVANSISGNLLTWTGLTSFSEFGIGGENDNPLPVQLSAFNVTTEARNALLSWETATEENAFKFVVEKKNIEAATWSVAGEVKASGNSNSPKKYSYTDQKLNSGKYNYRLKMIDNDGTFTYSDVVEVDISVPKDYAVSQNYPNPFNPTTKIDYQLPFDSRVQIELYNITGERVATLVNMDQKAGYYTFDFTNTSHLSSGVYIYRIIATGAAQDKPFTAVKKMVMMK